MVQQDELVQVASMTDKLMGSIQKEQARRNQMARHTWEPYAGHRRHVTDILLAEDASPSNRREKLAVLGAGNCNDIDLNELLHRFHEIHLVDLDIRAVAAGAEYQQLSGDARIVIHDACDLSGIAVWLNGQSPERIGSPDFLIEAANVALSAPLPDLPDDVDVVASTCLLSQLIESLEASIGRHKSNYLNVLFALRNRHLKMLYELPRPNGRALLITDFVSSDTVPDMNSIPDVALADHAMQWIASQNFFTGLNPYALCALIEQDSWFASRTQKLLLSRPWKWQFVQRMYAVCAIDVRLRPPQTV